MLISINSKNYKDYIITTEIPKYLNKKYDMNPDEISFYHVQNAWHDFFGGYSRDAIVIYNDIKFDVTYDNSTRNWKDNYKACSK